MVRQTGNGRIFSGSFGGFMAGIVERDDSVLQSATTDMMGLPGKKEFYQSALKEARESRRAEISRHFVHAFLTSLISELTTETAV